VASDRRMTRPAQDQVRLRVGVCSAAPRSRGPAARVCRVACAALAIAGAGLASVATSATPRFSDARSIPIGETFPSAVGLGDLNGDGWLDAVVGPGPNIGSESISVLPGVSSGGFGPPQNVPVPLAADFWGLSSQIDVADLNRDGLPDLLMIGHAGVLPMLGDGRGGFTAVTSAPYAVSFDTTDTALADLNGDGHLDIALASVYLGQPLIPQFRNLGTVQVLLGDGSGAFGAPITVGGGVRLAVGDVDGDGRPELVFSTGSSLAVVRSLGGSAFSSPVVSPGLDVIQGFLAGTTLAASDGRPSFLVWSSQSSVRSAQRWAPVGGLALAPTGPSFPLGDWNAAIGVADLDGDGRLDLVGAPATGATLTVSRGTAGNAFSAPESVPAIGGRRLADVNGDGAPDLVGTTSDYVVGPGVYRSSILFSLSLPTLQAAPTDFGAQAVGSESERQLLVTNTGAAPLRVVAPALGGPDAADFQIVADACSGRAVGPDASCALTLRFRPAAAGPRTASLRIEANDEAPAHELALTGLGTAPPPPGPAEVPTVRAGCTTRPTGGGTRLRCGLVLGPGAAVSRVTLRLVRGGRVRALADVRSGGRLVLRARRPLIAGRYTLVAVVVVADGRTRQIRREVMIEPPA